MPFHLPFSIRSVLCLASVAASTLALPCRGNDVPSRPNLIVIIADDLGYGELGCYGGDLPTPHLDALARSGVRCTDGYVTAPFCAASRAALMTGRLQTRFGFEFNPIGARNAEPGIGLPVDERTLADTLRDQGYVTSLVGKWHLGGTAWFHPHRRGFDEFFGFLHEGHYFVPPPWDAHVTWLRRRTLPNGSRGEPGRWTSADGRVIWSNHLGRFEPDYDADNPILRGSQPTIETGNLTEVFTREAEQFIDRHRQQPFFLCLAYNAVHSPMQARDDYFARFAHLPDVHRRIFAAMLAQLDDGIGRISAKLAEHQLATKTMVVFLSDNGGPTRELTSKNTPLRGEKGELYEGGIRVPFLISWPSVIPSGQIESRMISSLDISATFTEVAAAGIEKPTDGVNWIPYLQQKNPAELHSALYWRVGHQAAFRAGPWKIYRPTRPNSSWSLYNLKDDVGETNDLATREPERLQSLEEAWGKLDQEMVEPRWR